MGKRIADFSSNIYICNWRLPAAADPGWKLFNPLFSKKKNANIGIRVRATIRETSRVEIIETLMWYPIVRMIKFDAKTKGKKTMVVVSVAAKIDRQTSLVPSITASRGDRFF